MATIDPKYTATSHYATITSPILTGNMTISGSSGPVWTGKIDSAKIDWGDDEAGPLIGAAAAMTRVAHELSISLGISVKEALDSLEAASAIVARSFKLPDVGERRVELDLDEYGLLQRVAAMAGQMLGPMRSAGLNDVEAARFTALRNALVALQIYDGAAMPTTPLGDDEVVNDLADLLSDLAEPPTALGKS